MVDTAIDPKAFRSALGSFATGVTVVTTAVSTNEPIGVTASSFNSVSLDPPLVLWSLAKKSLSLDAFKQSGHFAVHILSCEQEDISNRFARSGADKFAETEWRRGQLGSPVLADFAAKFECRTIHQYEGGDHIIFVGEVLDLEQRDLAPLVFHGGKYAEARPRVAASQEPSVLPNEGRFTEDFFLYLLSRAHFQTSDITRTLIQKAGLTFSQYLAITVLGMNAPLSKQDLADRLAHTGQAPSSQDLADLREVEMLDDGDDGLRLTEKSRAIFIDILSEAKAYEDDLLSNFTSSEIADGKRLLKRIIELTGHGIPGIWSGDNASV